MEQKFEWNENKRALNIKKHGLDFVLAWTYREKIIRIISARRTNKNESKTYHARQL